jgi:hypothetical protein
MIITLTKEQESVLDMGYNFKDKKGNVYTYIPFWFKKKGDQYKIIHIDNLPKEIKERLNELDIKPISK